MKIKANFIKKMFFLLCFFLMTVNTMAENDLNSLPAPRDLSKTLSADAIPVNTVPQKTPLSIQEDGTPFLLSREFDSIRTLWKELDLSDSSLATVPGLTGFVSLNRQSRAFRGRKINVSGRLLQTFALSIGNVKKENLSDKNELNNIDRTSNVSNIYNINNTDNVSKTESTKKENTANQGSNTDRVFCANDVSNSDSVGSEYSTDNTSKNKQEGCFLYESWVLLDDEKRIPVRVLTSSVPQGTVISEQGTTNYGKERITLTGIYYRLAPYTDGNDFYNTPMIIGRNFEFSSKSDTPQNTDSQNSSGHHLWNRVLIAFSMILIWIIARGYFRRSSSRNKTDVLFFLPLLFSCFMRLWFTGTWFVVTWFLPSLFAFFLTVSLLFLSDKTVTAQNTPAQNTTTQNTTAQNTTAQNTTAQNTTAQNTTTQNTTTQKAGAEKDKVVLKDPVKQIEVSDLEEQGAFHQGPLPDSVLKILYRLKERNRPLNEGVEFRGTLCSVNPVLLSDQKKELLGLSRIWRCSVQEKEGGPMQTIYAIQMPEFEVNRIGRSFTASTDSFSIKSGLGERVGGIGFSFPLSEKENVLLLNRLGWYPQNSILGRLGVNVAVLDQVPVFPVNALKKLKEQQRKTLSPSEIGTKEKNDTEKKQTENRSKELIEKRQTVLKALRFTEKDREMIYELLSAVHRMKPDLLKREILKQSSLAGKTFWNGKESSFSVVELFNRPELYQGELIPLSGHVRRVLYVPISDPEIIQKYGLDHYYQLYLYTDDSQCYPLVISVPNLPLGMPVGSTHDFRENVSVNAFFCKTWAYKTDQVILSEEDTFSSNQKKNGSSLSRIGGSEPNSSKNGNKNEDRVKTDNIKVNNVTNKNEDTEEVSGSWIRVPFLIGGEVQWFPEEEKTFPREFPWHGFYGTFLVLVLLFFGYKIIHRHQKTKKDTGLSIFKTKN